MENLSPTATEPQVDDLTWREQEVLGLLASRLSNKEIGAKLHLAESTVKWYNQQIFSKLGASNRKQAVTKASTLQLLDPSTAPLPQENTQRRTNLPAQLSSFIGRHKETEEVKQLLTTSRLLTITGPGGSGKTRLAYRVAKDLLEEYKDGVWLVELAALSNPKLVPNEIATILQVSARGETSILELLKRYLSSKHLLLLIDNFEHVAAAASMLAELLAASPNLTILATSRSRLDIYGEQEYSLSPLNLPTLANPQSSQELLNYEAVDLFIQRAKSAQPGLKLDDEHIATIAQICVRLDGLPLAIELAAPLAKIYGLSALAQRLEEDLDTLSAGPSNLPKRQRTLQATMDWSYQLLDAEDKKFFDCLSVFSGGGTLEAIEAICSSDLSGKAIDRLASLEKNNLILPIETLDGEIHFTMLETIREYSRERLAKRADANDTHLKHATYYTELAERANRQIRSELNKYWFKRLRAENQNFRVALAWSLEGEESEYGLRLVGALLYHWYYNGLGSENRLFLDLALELSKKSTPTLRAGVLLTSAFLAYARGDLKTSHEQLEEALLLYQELGDEIKQGHALMHFSVSTIVGESPALNKELKLAHQALEIFRAHGDTANMAQAYNVLGELERTMRNYDAAKKHYKKALALSRESGETLREAILHINLAFIAFHEEDFVEANRLNKLGLGLFVELASFFGMASHLASFAGPIVALGYPKRAARLLGAANAHLELIGSYQQPADQPEIELFLKNAQEALTKDAFQTAWEEGQRMTIQEAVAYALSDEEVE